MILLILSLIPSLEYPDSWSLLRSHSFIAAMNRLADPLWVFLSLRAA